MIMKAHKALSVELQTVEFIDSARLLGGSRAIRLHARGFRVSLEYESEMTVPGLGAYKQAVAITDVYVPLRVRRKGWFAAYVRLCQLLADEVLIVFDVHGPVRESLLRKGFQVVAPDALMFRK
jgi:hypothetical protein